MDFKQPPNLNNSGAYYRATVSTTNMPGTSPQDAFGRVMQTQPGAVPGNVPANLLRSKQKRTDALCLTLRADYQRGYETRQKSATPTRFTQDLKAILPGLSVTALYLALTYIVRVQFPVPVTEAGLPVTGATL